MAGVASGGEVTGPQSRDIRLLTAFIHFGTERDYDRAAASHRATVPYRYNDVAGFIEVVLDDSTIKSYACLAARRGYTPGEPWRKPTRRLRNKQFQWAGKCSEVPIFSPRTPPTTEDVRAALWECLEDLTAWTRGKRWIVDVDEALIDCTDWTAYIARAHGTEVGRPLRWLPGTGQQARP
jgi:hypothetical protein